MNVKTLSRRDKAVGGRGARSRRRRRWLTFGYSPIKLRRRASLPRRHMVITGQPTCDHAGVLRESVLHSPASLGISVQGTPGQPIDAVKVSEIGPGLKRLRSGIGILPKSYFLQRLTTACNQLQNSRAGDLRDWLAHAGVLLIGRRRPSAIGHTQPLTA